MIRFFDTSAFVKRYVEEPGSAIVRMTLRSHPATVARATFAEAAAAVARACRLGAMSEMERDVILDRLYVDFSQLSVVEMRRAIVERVPLLVTRYPLRGYDAVQLASALAVRDTGISVELWCTDAILLDAASAEGFRVIKPQ